jgi:hypothetical protein
MERFSTFCRLCINSSDCVAKEKECSDSEGKRVRSSPKAKVGEAGAVGAASDGCLDTGGVAKFSDVERWVAEGGPREPGCWRMRRRPEIPMPCSCSGTMGDLQGTVSRYSSHARLLPAFVRLCSARILTWSCGLIGQHRSSCASPCLWPAGPVI